MISTSWVESCDIFVARPESTAELSKEVLEKVNFIGVDACESIPEGAQENAVIRVSQSMNQEGQRVIMGLRLPSSKLLEEFARNDEVQN